MNLPFLRNATSTRLSALLEIPLDDRSDYMRGSIDALQWALTEMEAILSEILPSGMSLALAFDENELSPDDIMDSNTFSDSNTKMSPARPPLYSTKPCRSERTHAYVFNTPSKGLKRCHHCQEVLSMAHGEKISQSKRRPEQHQEAWQLTANYPIATV